MSELVPLLLAICGFALGYMLRDVKDAIKALQEAVKSRIVKEKVKDEPKSLIIEALTPEQEARRDMLDRIQKINQ